MQLRIQIIKKPQKSYVELFLVEKSPSIVKKTLVIGSIPWSSNIECTTERQRNRERDRERDRETEKEDEF